MFLYLKVLGEIVMALLPAKCPECGGLVEVNDEKRAGLCKFCGQPFVIEDAIQTFNTYYNINNITNHNYGNGAVVNVYEDKTKDFVIEGGVLKKYQGESLTPVIPESVVEIGENCFKGLKITSVIIPESVTTIDKYAFYWCTNLTSISIPNSITGIGNEAFNGCYNLNAVYINDLEAWCNIIFNGAEANPLTFAKKLYLNNELITDLVIPDSVTSIGQMPYGGWVFSGCTSLISVKMSNNVTNIGHCVFKGCTNLQSITISNNITSFAHDVFEGCSNLKNINISIDVLIKIKNAFPKNLFMNIIKEHNVCQYCGGQFKKTFFADKCLNCGREKDY